MCDNCNECFSDEEKEKLIEKGWSEEQINYIEKSIVEDKIKELINNA